MCFLCKIHLTIYTRFPYAFYSRRKLITIRITFLATERDDEMETFSRDLFSSFSVLVFFFLLRFFVVRSIVLYSFSILFCFCVRVPSCFSALNSNKTQSPYNQMESLQYHQISRMYTEHHEIPYSVLMLKFQYFII